MNWRRTKKKKKKGGKKKYVQFDKTINNDFHIWLKARPNNENLNESLDTLAAYGAGMICKKISKEIIEAKRTR